MAKYIERLKNKLKLKKLDSKQPWSLDIRFNLKYSWIRGLLLPKDKSYSTK